MKARNFCPIFTFWLGTLFLFTNVVYSAQLDLSLKQAIDLALSEKGNTRLRLAEEMARRSEKSADVSRAGLLPNLEGYVGLQRKTVNLEAFGIQPNPILGIPPLVGPFTTIEARATLTQTIFDLSTIKRFQASKSGVAAARGDSFRTQDAVAAETAKAYIEALHAQAALDTAKASVELAEALLKLAESQKSAGAGTGIEVTRARVQLSNEKQLRLAAETEFNSALLQLVKLIGLPLGQQVCLTDRLVETQSMVASVETAIAAGLRARSDLEVQRLRERGSELSYDSVRWQRLPSLVGFADYGTIGVDTSSKLPTWAVGATLRIPIYDGGAVDAQRGEKASEWRQEQIRTEELERQIELEIRLAYQTLELAGQQLYVAREGLNLADQELQQARRRYVAGVTTSIEVTDAQSRLKRAEENRVTALYRHNLARIELYDAMGIVRSADLP